MGELEHPEETHANTCSKHVLTSSHRPSPSSSITSWHKKSSHLAWKQPLSFPYPRNLATDCLNDYHPVALTPVIMSAWRSCSYATLSLPPSHPLPLGGALIVLQLLHIKTVSLFLHNSFISSLSLSLSLSPSCLASFVPVASELSEKHTIVPGLFPSYTAKCFLNKSTLTIIEPQNVFMYFPCEPA